MFLLDTEQRGTSPDFPVSSLLYALPLQWKKSTEKCHGKKIGFCYLQFEHDVAFLFTFGNFVHGCRVTVGTVLFRVCVCTSCVCMCNFTNEKHAAWPDQLMHSCTW